MTVTWQQIEEFIRREACVSHRQAICAQTKIEEDLGITGDDSVEFMDKYFETFQVNPGDYDHCRYFHGEGFNILAVFLLFFPKRKSTQLRSLTIDMLTTAANIGRWDTQQLEQRVIT